MDTEMIAKEIEVISTKLRTIKCLNFRLALEAIKDVRSKMDDAKNRIRLELELLDTLEKEYSVLISQYEAHKMNYLTNEMEYVDSWKKLM